MAAKKVGGAELAGAAKKERDFATVTVSEEVLHDTPRRALKFITAVNRSLAIRAALEKRGMTPKVRAEGWELLRVCAGTQPDGVTEQELDVPVRDATAELDASDEELVETIRLTLEHTFPEQGAFVLKKLTAAKGPGAVFVVETALDRLDALEHGKGREKTRTEDHKALARLAQRELTPERRAELRRLVETAKGSKKPVVADPEAAAEAETAAVADHEEYLRSLRELRAWFEEWSGMARLVITRRDHLVRLGLAQQKAKKAKDAPADGTKPAKGS